MKQEHIDLALRLKPRNQIHEIIRISKLIGEESRSMMNCYMNINEKRFHDHYVDLWYAERKCFNIRRRASVS